MRNNQQKNKQGFALVLSILALALLLSSGSYLISMANSENKIAKAQLTATKNYYLAESGINEMIWKIQNDPSIGVAFLNGTLDETYDVDRSMVFGDVKADYQVAGRSTVSAEAWLTATSTYQIGSSVSQRVVKSYISQATGSTAEWEFSVFAGGRGSQQNGNFTFTGSGIVLTSNGGRLHANQGFKVQGAEVVINDGAVTSSNNINVVAGGRLTLNNSYQESPTSTVDMLQIDFDSADPNSWKNRATVTYTKNGFRNLPDNTVLNGIIYVSGDADIIGKNMTINGVLVAEGNVGVTLAGKNLTVNTDPAYGGGILAKNNNYFTTSGGTVMINGLIYAGNNLNITSSGTDFVINGSLAGFDARITSSGGSIILNYNSTNFLPVIDPEFNPLSPLIQIDHWEEQY